MKDWLTKAQVAEALGLSYRQFRDRVSKQPDFPRPVRVSRQVHFWNPKEIEQWLAKRRA